MLPKQNDYLSGGPVYASDGVSHGSRDSGPLVSSAELNMLLAPSLGSYTPSRAGRGFRYRNIFLMLCALWFIGMLLFSPEVVYQVLTFPPALETVEPYLQKRGWLYGFWLFFYGWSYAKDWHFERVALVCFASEVTILWMDYLAMVSYIAEPISPLLIIFVLLRLSFITCLLVNALYAHQAPPAPRSFFKN